MFVLVLFVLLFFCLWWSKVDWRYYGLMLGMALKVWMVVFGNMTGNTICMLA